MMHVYKVKVFDPLYFPDGREYPPRVEILVGDVDLHQPEETIFEDGWTVARYGGYLYLFWHEGDLGQKPQHDPEFNEEDLVFHEGWINTIGPIPHPLFPVSVTDGHTPMRQFFVPAPIVQGWLDSLPEDETESSLGRWTLQASTEYAFQRQIVFELAVRPRGVNVRAEHTRQIQGVPPS